MPHETKIPPCDLWEIVKFKEYLSDLETMKRETFYRKYQEYMGLSDAELNRILDQES